MWEDLMTRFMSTRRRAVVMYQPAPTFQRLVSNPHPKKHQPLFAFNRFFLLFF